MKEKLATRKSFVPVKGLVYTNIGGGDFKCLTNYCGQPFAIMQNIRSGWTFIAHGLGIYCTGEIDWDYSTEGRFEKI